MKIVIICILKLIYISMVSSQTKTPCHVCEYMGKDDKPKLDLKPTAADVPKRCDLVVYGDYYFDYAGMDDIYMYKADEAAIKSMIQAGLSVYTYVAYNGSDRWYPDILAPKDPATYDKSVCPLIQKLQELQPTGIILNIVNIFDGDDLANKLKDFITKLKQQLPKLKIALYLYPSIYYKEYRIKGLFDFSVTNSIVDLYFVDMNINNFICTDKLACEGTPITSQDKDELTLEVVLDAISQTAVDKSKSIACINIFPLTPDMEEVYSPYSKYCEDPSAAKSGTWCIDKSKKLYDMGAFVKKQNFGGVAVDWIEWDDIPGKCQCDKFPVLNLIFDGYDGKPIKPCPKIG